MIPIRVPVTNIQKFQNSKLGTLWQHKRGTVARLRRIHRMPEPPQLYLLTLRKSKVLLKIDPEEWSPVPTKPSPLDLPEYTLVKKDNVVKLVCSDAEEADKLFNYIETQCPFSNE